ncbi:catechol 2,3-dioxygenase-like lactoylglutathione lyase family enzyme [Bosea sp. BE271]|uniref:VOC family protein n=1 Tax=Bosea TaxID=85413 RepID=UPI0028604588|nr:MULTISPECIES: VOC family protein [Bosea]MDR6831520.1 catechol 2,3-dioxygenase-like lactoylglutathione lyase family enzyme [Bosea robiniae]MDR6898229.1 catechol 2,3-dioxygenase-like lactoylglutathione lyase family enzyme [Bosea sp. BE109]MDR7141626.1 catechol 2,3-dioxygenase-like lactoylglutathione lyase family enzyme [Bosea sp. BE168]MDR7178230.1 catechol 2,3-dioxygenase-like lactoylglutathione lyase family enzyme [Bosea sp. BE271]
MIHHVSLGTNDVARSRKFYDAVLGVLGLTLLKASQDSADYGVSTVVFSLETPVNGKPASAGNGVHIAFDAGGRRKVDEFHRVALLHGGSDAGAPGLRPEYDPHYYGAFVLDPDGNKIEAVTHHGK